MLILPLFEPYYAHIYSQLTYAYTCTYIVNVTQQIKNHYYNCVIILKFSSIDHPIHGILYGAVKCDKATSQVYIFYAG